jgi:hypothetical protein
MKTVAETAVMQLQIKEWWKPPQAGKELNSPK